MSGDRFDQVERRDEERRRAAADMGRMLGLTSEPEEPEKESGTSSVDAGERTPEGAPEGSTPAEKFRDLLLYDESGRPRR